jgi:hypothetical protein
VGGLADAVVLEDRGDGWDESDTGDLDKPLLGVWLSDAGGYAVGSNGLVAVKGDDGWNREALGDLFVPEELHAVWTDPEGGTWVVGGELLTAPLTGGVVLHKGNVKPHGVGLYEE